MRFALRIPEYYKQEIENLKGDTSINQFIINAIAEKVSALKTKDYLQQRASSADLDNIDLILDKVKDREPLDMDRL